MNGESLPGEGDELERLLEGGELAGSPLSSLLGSARAGLPSADGFTVVAGSAGAAALIGGAASLASGSGGSAAAAGAGTMGAAGAGAGGVAG
ncbi:hypothetical protein, partial [Dietzia timorensis]|uniref:hypothetical protein n=1 Tax=Dietzia timorensis TaxID=499555 RepID=UPI0018D3A6DD